MAVSDKVMTCSKLFSISAVSISALSALSISGLSALSISVLLFVDEESVTGFVVFVFVSVLLQAIVNKIEHNTATVSYTHLTLPTTPYV